MSDDLKSALLELLASPEGRAAIAECMRRPPIRMADGTWREPTPGSEARPGDVVREIGGSVVREVYRVDGDDTWVVDWPGKQVWRTDNVEVICPREVEHRDRPIAAVPR